MGLEGIQHFNKDNANINDNKNINNGAETYSPSSSGSSTIMDGVPSKFPAGLRVMVVDDDPVCLQIINKMLKACQYEVTTCNQASTALTMLREKKDSFDLVLSDVYMPDMDGFQLLELIGLEMDLPVIMMSADGETSVVMKGIKHGACDYLLKPIRIEALKTIWQHVIRKKNHNEPKEVEHSGSVEEDDRKRKGSDDLEYASSINEGNSGLWKTCKRKKDSREDEEDGDQENDDSSTLKKPRVVWSVDLHQQFVHAVNQLGIDKAVPKRILELMNVQGLTRENVASHLQKYRLYLKKINGTGQSQSGFNPSSFVGSPEMSFGPLSPLERHELQPFSTSRQTLGGGGMIGQLNGNEGTSPIDMPFLFQPEIQGLNCSLTERLRFGQHSFGREKSYLQGLSTGIDFKGISPSFEHLPSFGKGALSDVAGFPVQLASSPRSFGPFGGVNNIGVLASPHSNGTIHNRSMYHPSQNLSAPPTPHPLLHLPRCMPGGLGHHQGSGRGQNEGSDGLHMLNLPSSNILNQQLLPSDGITSPLSMIVNGNNGGMGSRHLPIVESHTDGDPQNCRFSIPKTPMASLGDMGMAQGNKIMENHANSGYVYDQNKNKPLWHGQNGMHNGDCNSDQDLEFSQSLQGVDNNGIPGLMIEGHEGVSKMGMKLQNDHLVDNSLSLKKDGTSSLMGNSDLDGRLLHEPLDDIMSVLKQQQEEEDTFSDGEFTNDIYQLDATSMK